MKNQITNVIIASQNPVKIDAVTAGFQKLFTSTKFTFSEMSTDSGVPDQPIGDAETLQGAKNRVTNAKLQMPDAEYWVGIEGGISTGDDGAQVFAWVYILDSFGQKGQSRVGSFYLPHSVTQLIEQGTELGHATDQVFNEDNTKQNAGTIGLLTHNVISRTDYYVDAVVYALIPFANQELYAA